MDQHSKVVNSPGENAALQKFFTKKIIGMTLLYVASDDEFSAEKFHQKCDAIPHTLTLCETTYNKKIGGYTPLTWEATYNEKYKIDEGAESFIFSLTHNDKFVLKEKDLAIKNRKNFGPRFGSNYFLI